MTEKELNRTSILTQLAHHRGTGLGSESLALGSQIFLKPARDQPTNIIKCFSKLDCTHVATTYSNRHVVWALPGEEGPKEDLVLTSKNLPYC